MKPTERKHFKTEWKKAWRYVTGSRNNARTKAWYKKVVHRAARRNDGIIRLNPWDVV